MRILTRYVLSEVGKIFLVTLFSLTTLIMIVGIAKEAILQGLNLQHMLRLIPFMLPNALLYSVPGTILFAVTNVYGRMSGSNEIVAIKSLGLSPMVFLWPTIVLSILLSFLTVWLNDVAMTWGYYGMQQVVVDAIEDVIYSMLKMHHSYSVGGLSINVKTVDGKKLVNPTFTFAANGDTPPVTITAQWAELRATPGSGVLTIICHDGTVDVGGTTFDFPDTLEREIPLGDAASRQRTGCAHAAERAARADRSAAAEHRPQRAAGSCRRGLHDAERRICRPEQRSLGATGRGDALPVAATLPLDDRAAAPLGQRFQLPVLRASGLVPGDVLAQGRGAVDLLPWLSAGIADLLSAVDAGAGSLKIGIVAADVGMAGQRAVLAGRPGDSPLGYPLLIGRTPRLDRQRVIPSSNLLPLPAPLGKTADGQHAAKA